MIMSNNKDNIYLRLKNVSTILTNE